MNVNVFKIGDKVRFANFSKESHTGTICSGLINGTNKDGVTFLCYLVQFDHKEDELGGWFTLRAENGSLNYFTTIFVINENMLTLV